MENEEPPSKRPRLSSRSPPPSNNHNPTHESRSNMTEREKEHQVGIQAYVNLDTKPVSGILKTRYTDFLVNEVLPNRKVVHLQDITAPKADQPAGPNGNARETKQTPANLPEIPEEQKSKLAELLNPTAAREICELYESVRGGQPNKPVRTEFTTDRTIRGEIHQFIRSTFHSAVDSRTEQDGNLILTPILRSGKSKNQRNQQRHNWADGGHLHFTLYKENKDTMEVISRLARQLKTNAKTFQFAGTKDRRAVTAQRCSAYHIEADRLAGQNRQLWGAKVGDFAYQKHGLELGDLSGNEFTITLRDVQAESLESLQELLTVSMRSLREQGFINYYGQQRFGTFSVRTDDIGRHILKENFKAAIDAILAFSPSTIDAEGANRDDRDRAKAISKWRTDNKLNEALDTLPRKFSAEASIIRHLSRQPTDFLGALLTVQRNLRLMYVHAYQSLVWNLAASHRLKHPNVIAGDLVLIKEHNLQPAPKIDTVDENGEQVILPSGEDAAVDKDDVFERARALTAEEAASGKFSMFDIVLPQPGYDVEYPNNETGAFYEEYMKGDGLDPKGMRRKQRDFSLSGAYRKVLARIEDGWEVSVHKYRKDEEQFVKTDLELINERDVGQAAEKPNKIANGEDLDTAMDEDKFAAVLKFQLGASQYATMALRELSKGGISAHKTEFSTAR